jgi:hypothetical protein
VNLVSLVYKDPRVIRATKETKVIPEKLALRVYKVFLGKPARKVCRDRKAIKEILLHILISHKPS